MRPASFIFCVLASALSLAAAAAETGHVETVAPDVSFHQGDHERGHCNNGWIEFDDSVLVVDANYPSGAEIVIPKIRAQTSKPLRFVIDTHFHPDHSFGNQLWADAGALIVAQVATRDELERSGAAAWADAARIRPDVRASRLHLPDVTYTDELVFSDAHHRVELHFFGVGHTHGDTLVWLPREKILFTGDLCVNGAYNYVHDSDLVGWIAVLDRARALGAAKVCPGHGPVGGPEILAEQQRYLVELRQRVHALVVAGRTPADVKAAVPAMAAELRQIPGVGRYVPTDDWFSAHVEKAYASFGGAPFPP